MILDPDSRRNNFDFLRFVFASLVLLYHCFPLLRGAQASGTAARWAEQAGGSAVDCFFVISGFLVTASWLRAPQVGPFLKKRALRIYPGFLAASLFCALVIGPLGADGVAAYWHAFHVLKFAVYLFLLPADVVGPDRTGLFAHQPYPGVLDGSFWTLRYEFEMYLLVAAFGLVGLYRPRARLMIALLFALLYLVYAASSLTSWLVVPYQEYAWAGNPARWLRLLVCFLSGMTVCLWRDRLPFSRLGLGVALGVLGLASLTGTGLNAALPLSGSYALFYAAFSPRLRLQGFARYGDFSYGVYLFAFPVQQLLVHDFGAHLTPGRLFLTAFPLTLACAALSWHLVEKPALSWKRATRLPGDAGRGA